MKITPAQLLLMVFAILVLPFLPLLVSWRWSWREAWVYAAIAILGFIASRLLIARRHPDLISERARTYQHADAKPWDRLLAPLAGLGSGVILLIAGLEMRLHPGAEFSLPLKLAALALILAGYVLSTYALLENRFFSGVVRIQTERGHHVVSSGPYAWVRHPGYLGGLLSVLPIPIWLDSPWAILPACLYLIVLVVRTRLEDATLQTELPGYAEYAQKVRYRLLPGVW